MEFMKISPNNYVIIIISFDDIFVLSQILFLQSQRRMPLQNSRSRARDSKNYIKIF